MSPVSIALALVAGVVLFLYGVHRLSEGMRALAGDRLDALLARFTGNRLAAVATGVVATAVLDSSSVVIVMTIALVSAGALSFHRSLGVILGANIGTTISSQIIAFDVDEYAPVVLLAGLVLQLGGRTQARRNVGAALLGIGLVFFGLREMGDAVAPLAANAALLDQLARMDHPAVGVTAGALLTVLVQSSSATVAMVITLADEGLLSLAAGVAIMLGAEVGTCADTLLATVGRTRDAVRAGVFHLAFNVATVAAGVFLTTELASLAVAATPGAGLARHVANAHVLFNVLGVLVALPFLPRIAWLLERAIPAAAPSRAADGDEPLVA